jgi:hypothetical protein
MGAEEDAIAILLIIGLGYLFKTLQLPYPINREFIIRVVDVFFTLANNTLNLLACIQLFYLFIFSANYP